MKILPRFLHAWLLPVLAAASTALAQTDPAPDLPGNPRPATTRLDPALPTLWIAGDSTAARGRGAMQQGWGVPVADYFDPAKINVANRARGGRSSRTFVSEGLWDQLLAGVKKGDTVLIQFGHNDGGPINSGPARGSLPGLGEETQDVEGIVSKRAETVHTYGWYLRKMVADVKAKGASPIVLSLTLRNIWKDGKIERGSGRFSQWSYEIAKAAAVPFVDLMNTQGDAFDILGEPAVKALYQQDHTHFNAEGANLHAQTVVALLKGLRPSPITKVLSPKGEAIVADKFSWLRLPRPINPKLPSLILVGDSTVRNGRGDGVNGQWGWGDFLSPHFDAAKLNVVNRAVGGTGARSFGPAGYWDAALALVKPGDVVLIQFGTNDNGPRGALRGTGSAAEEREDATTKEKENVRSFGEYLRRYVADIRAKQATPVLCSLVPRNIWKDGKIARTSGSHADWTREVAAAEHVAYLDLHETIASRYEALGQAAVNPLFADVRVHTTRAGAELNAECVVAALGALPQNPLAPFLLTPTTAR